MTASDLFIGRNTAGLLLNPKGSGSAVISSGTVRVTRTFRVGGKGIGSLVLNGGSITSALVRTGGGSAATINGGSWDTESFWVSGSLTLNGGEVTSDSSVVGGLGGGTLTVNGGTWSGVGEMRLTPSGTGILNLDGSTADLEASTLRSGTFGMDLGGFPIPSGTGRINFNGGILRALADGADFVDGFQTGTLDIKSGGAFKTRAYQLSKVVTRSKEPSPASLTLASGG